MALDPIVKLVIALELLLGVGALGGGLALMAGPAGEILPLPVAILAGSPFASFFLPGLILFTVLGLGPLVAAWLALRRHHLASFCAFATGIALLVWIGVEIVLVGYSNRPPLQAIYLLFGTVLVATSLGWYATERRSATASV